MSKMDIKINTTTDIILDIIYSFFITFLIPFFFIIILNVLFTEFDNPIISFITILWFNSVILIIILYYYRKQFKILHNYSLEVGYVHFKPSKKDIILGMYSSFFSIIILLIIFLVIFKVEMLSNLKIQDLLNLSFVLSSLYLLFMISIMGNSKNKLVSTSRESIDKELILKIKEKIHISHKIEEFRFADIKPASLFLTAGVTKYRGYKNICLVSRYFQWKLSEDELYAVLSHEMGHINNKDLLITYILLIIDFLIRIMFYTSFIVGLKFIIFRTSEGYTIFEFFIVFNILLIMLSSILLRFIAQYRAYNQEIKSDEFGSRYVGNFMMAYTLQKLPSVIPAPINDNPLEFLGFRVALLKNRAKIMNEPDLPIKRAFSRYSNN